jgi:hypothetical protein
MRYQRLNTGKSGKVGYGPSLLAASANPLVKPRLVGSGMSGVTSQTTGLDIGFENIIVGKQHPMLSSKSTSASHY